MLIWLLLLVLPLALWTYWEKLPKILYKGKAALIPAAASIGRSPSRNCFVGVIVPGFAGAMLAEIPIEKARELFNDDERDLTLRALEEQIALEKPSIPVLVHVAKRPLGKPFITKMMWESTIHETKDFTPFSGVLTAVLYMVAGFTAAVLGAAAVFSVLYFIVCGFLCGFFMRKSQKNDTVDRIIFTVFGVIFAAAGLFVSTASPGLLFTLGFMLCVASGQLAGMLIKGEENRRAEAAA